MYFQNISTNLGGISYNVQDWRRFASPNKGLRSKTRAGKMWVKGGVGASVATDLADRNSGAAEQAAERIPFVMRRTALRNNS